MSIWPKPEGYIESYEELKVGMIVWHVYGHYQGGPIAKGIVAMAPRKYRDHPKRDHLSPDDDPWYDVVVFEVRYPRQGIYHGGCNGRLHFAVDGNLVPGVSHNDNYWFADEELAKKAKAMFDRLWALEATTSAGG